MCPLPEIDGTVDRRRACADRCFDRGIAAEAPSPFLPATEVPEIEVILDGLPDLGSVSSRRGSFARRRQRRIERLPQGSGTGSANVRSALLLLALVGAGRHQVHLR